jgi:hypothetical protein
MTKDQQTISLWEAIKQMRKLSSEGKSFSLVHYTFNRETLESHGLRSVIKAKLRPAAKEDDVKNADHKLFYIDETIHEPRNCWQILIREFNGMLCILN